VTIGKGANREKFRTCARTHFKITEVTLPIAFQKFVQSVLLQGLKKGGGAGGMAHA
jgi:hypothetical protein